MELNQGKVAEGLAQEIMQIIYKYEETLYTPTVLGVLDLIKQQIIFDATGDEDEEE